MFASIFAFALITTHIAAEIPSYINVCGRKDPDLTQCIEKNINNLKSKICEGIPELDIPSNDPLILDKLVLSDTNNTKIFMRDVRVSGLCNFDIKHLDFDVKTFHAIANISFERVLMNGTYDFDVRVLVPIVQKGEVYITSDNIDAQVIMDFKQAHKDGKTYMYMSQMKLNIDIKRYDIKYDLNESQASQLGEAISNFLGNNQEEIINVFKPVLEEVISKRVLLVSNDIVKHFTYEELFPDRT